MRILIPLALSAVLLASCRASTYRCCAPDPAGAPSHAAPAPPATPDRSPVLKAVASASNDEAQQHVLEVLDAKGIDAVATSTARGGTVSVPADDVVRALDALQVALRRLRFSADHPIAQFEVILP